MKLNSRHPVAKPIPIVASKYNVMTSPVWYVLVTIKGLPSGGDPSIKLGDSFIVFTAKPPTRDEIYIGTQNIKTSLRTPFEIPKVAAIH